MAGIKLGDHELKVYGYTCMFYLIYKGAELLQLPASLPGPCSPFRKGSTLKGKKCSCGSKFFP